MFAVFIEPVVFAYARSLLFLFGLRVLAGMSDLEFEGIELLVLY